MAIDIQIGQRLRQRRMACDLSQEELGDRVGVTFQQIQKYEKGTNRVSGSRLLAICGVLKIRPGALLDDLVDGWDEAFEYASKSALALAVEMDRIKHLEVRKSLMALARVLADTPN